MDRTAGSATYDAAVVELFERKRRIYLLGAAAAIVVLITSWLGRDNGDVMVGVGYPIVIVAVVVHALAVWRRWLTLPVIEATAYLGLAMVVLGRLTWHLHFAGTIDEHLLVLVGGHYWAVAALIVAGFVVFDLRRGVWVGSAVIATSIMLVITGAGSQLVGPGASRVALIYLVRVHGFLLVLLALAAAIATMRAHLHRALVQAELLERLATTDHLTGLANRRSASDALREHVAMARRYGHDLSVITVDLDSFKTINDQYGHDRGDLVLQEVGAVLASQARDVDTVARWGGEEFLLIMPETGHAGATAMAKRCLAALKAARPAGLDLTATFGVAKLGEEDTLSRLLVRADELLYEGKRAGRDRVMTVDDVAHLADET